MALVQFVWDEGKARLNLQKHGVAFQEAMTVFYDGNAVEIFDDEHSDPEDRFLLLGLSHKLRILMVSYCHRDKGNIIRIISARKATRNECKHYPYRSAP